MEGVREVGESWERAELDGEGRNGPRRGGIGFTVSQTQGSPVSQMLLFPNETPEAAVGCNGSHFGSAAPLGAGQLRIGL